MFFRKSDFIKKHPTYGFLENIQLMDYLLILAVRPGRPVRPLLAALRPYGLGLLIILMTEKSAVLVSYSIEKLRFSGYRNTLVSAPNNRGSLGPVLLRPLGLNAPMTHATAESFTASVKN